MGLTATLSVLGAGAFAVSYLIAYKLTDPSSRLYLLDHPNDRSLHDNPTPRGGGLGICIAVLLTGCVAGWLTADPGPSLWILLAALLVVGVSYMDDHTRVHPASRIAVHCVAAGVLLFGGLLPGTLTLPGAQWHWPVSVGVLLTLLYVVWLVNLYNFMDGMDGFAAGMAVVGFGCFAVLGALQGAVWFASLSFLVAAGCSGFLALNFPPARIFMGDVGSSVLGLLVASLSLWADRDGLFPLWVSVLVFSPFIVDATVTLAMRVQRGERVWEAHRTHYYQRLARLGWGHRRTVLWEYALMVACAVSAWVALSVTTPAQWLLLCLWVVAYTMLAIVVRHLETPQRGASSGADRT